MLKKTQVATIIILLFISCFSGCTLLSIFEETEFSLFYSNIIDDNGFTSLSLSFNTSDKITLKLLGPNRNIMFSEDYYKGYHEESILLEEYRKTPPSGTYYLKVYDTDDKKIFENELCFSEQNITITKVLAKRWFYDGIYNLVGLTITIKNLADLPVYPHLANIKIDDKESSGLILPSVILPHQTKNVDCFTYINGIPIDDYILELSLKNYNGEILADITQTINSFKKIPDLEYSWEYKGYDNALILPNVEFLYDYYSSLERLVLEDYAVYIFDVYDDQYIELVVNRLMTLTDLTDDVLRINFAASFVQSLEYAEDDKNDPTCEYPRYPVEMLKDAQGDCEDKAMLTAALLDYMNYNVSLIRLPNHMAVGVHLDEDLPAYEYYVEGFYYLETTRNSWVLGRVPEDYKDLTNISVHPISYRPILVHSWSNATRFSSNDGSDYVNLNILVENIGRKNAYNFEIKGAFYNQNNVGFNKETISITSLNTGEKKVVELKINVPKGFSTNLKTQIYVDNEIVHEKESSSSFP